MRESIKQGRASALPFALGGDYSNPERGMKLMF